MTSDECTCGRLRVGLTVTEARDWNPDCPKHGTASAWYASPAQRDKRAEASARLRDLQRRAADARKAARHVEGDGPIMEVTT